MSDIARKCLEYADAYKGNPYDGGVSPVFAESAACIAELEREVAKLWREMEGLTDMWPAAPEMIGTPKGWNEGFVVGLEAFRASVRRTIDELREGETKMRNINEGVTDIPTAMPVQQRDYVQGTQTYGTQAKARIAELEAERDRLRAMLTEALPRIVEWATGSNDDIITRIRAALSTEATERR